VFANVVSARGFAGLPSAVDAFFAACRRRTRGRRRSALSGIVTEDVTFSDAFSCTAGIDDLVAHLAAAQMHMPGIVLSRTGEVRQCQGTAVVDWTARGRTARARQGHERLRSRAGWAHRAVVGFWGKGFWCPFWRPFLMAADLATASLC
jgi:hypothetical protein